MRNRQSMEALPFFLALSAKELGDSGKQKMNVSDNSVVTVPYDDEVKTYEEPAKRESSAVFFGTFG
jgi:hypothetical protein